MKKIMIGMAIVGLMHAEVDLWNQESHFTIRNETSDPIQVTWRSGGGHTNLLTGRRGTFELAAGEAKGIVTSQRDYLDYLEAVSMANPEKKMIVTQVSNPVVTIKYVGDLKNQQLVIQ